MAKTKKTEKTEKTPDPQGQETLLREYSAWFSAEQQKLETRRLADLISTTARTYSNCFEEDETLRPFDALIAATLTLAQVEQWRFDRDFYAEPAGRARVPNVVGESREKSIRLVCTTDQTILRGVLTQEGLAYSCIGDAPGDVQPYFSPLHEILAAGVQRGVLSAAFDASRGTMQLSINQDFKSDGIQQLLEALKAREAGDTNHPACRAYEEALTVWLGEQS